ncbi:MAG: hypothetical protein D6773_11065, partial [Alphaproteobacteria bacterium]
MSSDPSQSGRKEGRIARHLRIAGEVRREPRRILPLLRGWLLGIWQRRGAGFYGLGFLITFIVLEVRMFGGDIAGSDNVAEALVVEVLTYIFRLGFMSFLNALLALLWPLYLIDRLGGFGLVVLIGGYFAFETLARPVVEG